MKTLRFKTNAKCGGCVAGIGKELDKILSAEQWSVDLASPDRVLTVTSDRTADEIRAAVEAAGFRAESLG